MRVFLTGGSGFLGSHVAAELVRRDHGVICLCRNGSRPARLDAVRDAITLEPGDLHRRDQIDAALAKHKPDALCHLAWHGVFNVERNDPRQHDNAAAAGTLASSALAFGVRTIVATGSQAEYGPLNGPARESDALRPTTAYGRAKCEARRTLLELCADAGVRFAWLRVFSLYGPMDNDGWLIPSLIQALLDKRALSLTAGEQIWDFLYVADAARAIADVLETPTAAGDFNLGSGLPVPLRHVIEAVRDLIDPGAMLGFGEIPYRPDQVMHLEADVDRLRHAVGWRPTTNLADGLAQTVAWYRRNYGCK
ncbi:MAG: NAD(P)-dependent oxidoreductase [Alphaproteobacteria bacterium]|nr:NAD(P)-dependent oxidoreductase [Alphaproteobacteria bacterium]